MFCPLGCHRQLGWGLRGFQDPGLSPFGDLREASLEAAGNVCSTRPHSLQSHARFRGCFPETRCPCVPTDPMNALQSLTGGPAAGAAGIGMPSRGPGQSLGGMGGIGTMGQPMPLSGQPPPGPSGMAPHGMAVVSTAAPQSEYRTSETLTHSLKPRWILFLGLRWHQEKHGKVPTSSVFLSLLERKGSKPFLGYQKG